jgi:hypothetical protein
MIRERWNTCARWISWYIRLLTTREPSAHRRQLTGGGPLASDVGDALVRAGCKLYLLYGATEIGFVTK